MTNMNPKQFVELNFAYEHLPAKLQEVSKPFGDLAKEIVARGGRYDQMTGALWDLLRAKDCAVRAVM